MRASCGDAGGAVRPAQASRWGSTRNQAFGRQVPTILATADVRHGLSSRHAARATEHAPPERSQGERKVLSAELVRPRHGGRVATFARSGLLPFRTAATPRGHAPARERFDDESTRRDPGSTSTAAEHAAPKGDRGAPKRVGRREARHAPVTTARREACGAHVRTKAISVALASNESHGKDDERLGARHEVIGSRRRSHASLAR